MSEKINMKPNFFIVKRLFTKYFEITEYCDKLSAIGISVPFFEGIDLDDIALDLIGFPADNTADFDFEKLNGRDSSNSNLRTDWDNMFCRDRWTELIYEYYNSKDRNLNELIQKLYDEYDLLILEKPDLFVRP